MKKIGQRKVIIFMVCLAAGISASFFMKLEFYQVFLNNLIWLAGGFFAGNAVEHFGTSFSRRWTGKNDNTPGSASQL